MQKFEQIMYLPVERTFPFKAYHQSSTSSFALIIAYVSVLMSPKEWVKNTFGWARAEVLVNAVFLIYSSFIERRCRVFGHTSNISKFSSFLSNFFRSLKLCRP
uniref:Uncharacterized protein n=1 Tax=Tetranychus urticae TaxID=32264 RepID=T1L0U9_TETUR